MTYPALAIANKTNNFKPHLGWTLDDFRRIERGNPDEAAAILWLSSAPDGVVAEAVGGSYSDYGRVSVYTGLPAVLGWPGHEVQWRGTADPQGSRQDDIKILYESARLGQRPPDPRPLRYPLCVCRRIGTLHLCRGRAETRRT